MRLLLLFIINLCLIIVTSHPTEGQHDGDGGIQQTQLLDNETPGTISAAVLAKHERSGIIVTETGSSSSSASGGEIRVGQSANWRSFASKIVQQPQAIKIHRLDPVNRQHTQDNNEDKSSEGHLHSAFQLPLQRLSDAQLLTLLNRYHSIVANDTTNNSSYYENLTRKQKITELQKLIVQKEQLTGGKPHLIRPTLLTNVNVLSEIASLQLPSSFPIHNQADDQILTSTPRITNVNENNFKSYKEHSIQVHKIIEETAESTTTPKELSHFAELISKIKERYEQLKRIFNAKLKELNERKMRLKLLANQQQPKELQNVEVQSNTTTAPDQESTNESLKNIELQPQASTAPVSEDERKSSDETLKFVDSTSNEGILDSDNESIKQTYPSELITKRPVIWVASAITLLNTSNIEQTVAESSAQPTEITSLSTSTLSPTTTAERMLLIDNDTAEGTINQTTVVTEEKDQNLGDLQNTDKTISKFTQYTQIIERTKNSSKGILDNETEAKDKLLTSLFETTSDMTNINESNDKDNENIDHNLSIEKLIKYPVPRAQPIPKIFGVTQISEEDEDDQKDEQLSSLMKSLQEDLDEQNVKKGSEPVDSEVDEQQNNNKQEICDAVACNFENGDLCQWEASMDEVLPGSRAYKFKLRRVRSPKNKTFVWRTWHNWEGRYRNRLTGIARAQVFSHENQRFAATYVKPNQRATLTTRFLSNKSEIIRFRAWEATNDLRLRVCCDTITECVFETEKGVHKGSRNWKEYTATCPKGTQLIIFDCVNDGIHQGACGIDNVHLLNDYCPKIIPLVGLQQNRRKL